MTCNSAMTRRVIFACAAVALAACGNSPTTGTTPATSSVATTASQSPQAKDDAYLALLGKWSKRDGWQMGDTDQLIAAGHKVCALMNQGEGNIVASHDVMQQFNFSGQVAQAVGVAAWDTFCPNAEK
jgi:hypothetical protein